MGTSGPSEQRHVKIEPYEGAAGGWGSLTGIAKVLAAEHDAPVRQLMRQNKPDGFACVSCAWAKPAQPHPAEFCENGAKATAWDLTPRRCEPEFFAAHTVSELRTWSDYDLEQTGRLTDPMRYDAASDRYVQCCWRDAFEGIARELRAIEPNTAVFYTSGRASLETSYMYALMARMYGSQNLPDSSNMCHESTSVGLKKSIGAPVGTVTLEDFAAADCLLFFGQNVGSNSPRMLHDLQAAARRGVPIITFNPLHETGLQRFKNPQSPVEMLSGETTRVSSEYYQVKAGGDLAVMTGLCKWLIERDDAERAAGRAAVLDHAFIAQYTHGFEAFADFCRATPWSEIERNSGLPASDIGTAAATYAAGTAAMGVYGMGLTQHRLGVQNVNMICNLLLLRGNIGRPGAGVCPVRGHSNVQGQRTVGITEKPELAPLDVLKAQYGFEPPREKGLNTVEVCEGVLAGTVRAFVGLGGNFLRAVPDGPRIEAAWSNLRLTAHIATKLNRSHLVPGKTAYLLPCLSRIEHDEQASGPQTVAVEDFDQLHPRLAGRCAAGQREPAIRGGDRRLYRPGHPAGQSQGRLAGLGRRLRAGARRHRGDLPAMVRRLQPAVPPARRLPSPEQGAKPGFQRGAGRQGQFHRPHQPVGDGLRGRRGCIPADDPALERPVQHHHLWLRRPVPRHQGHARGVADERGGHGAARPGRGSDRVLGIDDRRRRAAGEGRPAGDGL